MKQKVLLILSILSAVLGFGLLVGGNKDGIALFMGGLMAIYLVEGSNL